MLGAFNGADRGAVQEGEHTVTHLVEAEDPVVVGDVRLVDRVDRLRVDVVLDGEVRVGAQVWQRARPVGAPKATVNAGEGSNAAGTSSGTGVYRAITSRKASNLAVGEPSSASRASKS